MAQDKRSTRTETIPADPSIRRARRAVTAVFGANGLLIASLAVRTPSLKIDLDLTAGQLGLLSALFGIAAVGMMQGIGSLAARTGSRVVVRGTTVVLPLLLVGIGAAPTLWWLAAAHLALGAVHGMLDVSMNAHAVAVEQRIGRPIMNGLHAAWSIGAVAGATLGAAAAQVGLSRTVHYLLLAAVLIPLAMFAGRALLPSAVDRRTGAADAAARTTWRTGWSLRVVLLGVMGAIVLTVEAAVADWSGVFLHENLHASLGVAGLGYVAFSMLQTAGRLVGDRLQERTSTTRMLRIGTSTAAVGVALAVASPWPALSIVAFALVGAGLATPLPVLFGVVGRLGAADGGAPAMVARFTTLTYTGILLAPAVIGWVAELIGLRWTLAALAPLLAAVAFAAGLVRQEAPSSSPAAVGTAQ